MAANRRRRNALSCTGFLPALLAGACDDAGKPATPPSAIQESVTDDAGATTLDLPLERPVPGDAAKAAELVKQALEWKAAMRPGDARKLLEQALLADPACSAALVELGFLLLDKGPEYNGGLALLQFRLARLLEPDHPLAVCGEGIARAEVGDLERAEPLLRRSFTSAALRAEPGRLAAATGALGGLCATQGKNDEALALLGQAAANERLPPRNRASHLVRRADLLAELGRREEAEQQVRAALALDPEQLRGHYLLRQLLEKRGATDEAQHEARIHELLRQLGDHLSRRILLDVERHLTLWRELVAASPEWTRGRYQFVRELLGAARWSEALAEIGALVRRDGASAETAYLTACAKAGANDLAGAKAAAALMFQADRAAPPGLVRSILDYWRKASPPPDDATFQRTLQEWMAGG